VKSLQNGSNIGVYLGKRFLFSEVPLQGGAMLSKDDKSKIEELTQCEYFDLIIERELDRKSREFIKQRKWIFSLILFFFLAIGSIFGWQVSDIAKENLKFKTLNTNMKSQVDKMMVKSKKFDENIENRISEFENRFIFIKEINQSYRELYKDEFTELKNKVNNGVEGMASISKITEDFTIENAGKFEKLQSLIDSTQRKVNNKMEIVLEEMGEVKSISSVVYAYVEKGKDRKPGTKEYKPAFVDLPFSEELLVVTFNRVSKFQEKTFVTGRGVKVPRKEAELFITIYDEEQNKVSENVMILQECKVASIPGTKHNIEAKFIYLPPNPTLIVWPVIIPDFVILEITLNTLHE